MTDDSFQKNYSGNDSWNQDSPSNNTNALHFIVNKKGELIDISDALCQVIGRKKEDLLGEPFEETRILTEESRKNMMYRNISRLIGNEKPSFTIEMVTKEQGIISLEITSKPYMKNGEIIGEIGNVRRMIRHEKNDSSERELRETKKELERLKGELEGNYQKMSALQDSVDEKQRLLQDMQGEIEQKDQELQKCQSTIAEKNKAISEITLKLSDVNSEQGELVENLKNKDIYITFQNEIIDWKNKENEKQQQTIEEQAGIVHSQQDGLSQKNALVRDLYVELEIQKGKISEEIQTIDILRQEIEELNQEVASRSKIIDDMVSQCFEKQTLLTEKTLQVETLQSDVRKRDDETETLHLEIETRNRIIDTIQGQLTQSQSQLIEDSYLTDQLSDELEWNRNLLAETRDELAKLEEELLSKTHEGALQHDEIEKVQDELEIVREEFVTRGKLIEEMEQQLADQQMIVAAKTQEIAVLHAKLKQRNEDLKEKLHHLAKAQEDVDDLCLQVASRNTLIGELQNQVVNNQTSLLENTLATEQLHKESEGNKVHIEKKEFEIVQLKTELTDRLRHIEDLTAELNRKEDEVQRLQDELEKSQEAREALTADLLESKEVITDSEMEINQLKTDYEERWIDLILKNIEVRDFKEQTTLLQTKLEQQEQLFIHTQSELDEKENELRNRTSETEEKLEMIATLKNEIATRSELLANIEEELTKQQTRLIQKTQQTEQLHSELEQRNTQLEGQQQELLQKETDIKKITEDSNEQQKKITQLQAEIEQRKRELNDYSKSIANLEHERDKHSSLLENMKNSIPTPLLFVDKDHMVTTWNKKATDMLGLGVDNEKKLDLFSLDVMEKERVNDGILQCYRDKKPVMIKSISLKNRGGTRFLTDISLVPILDGDEETQGAFMIVHDISDVTEIQARLERQKEEILALELRYQDAYAKLKVSGIEKNAICDDLTKVRTELDSKTKTAGHVDVLLEEKKRELETTNELITSKVHELNDITKKLDGIRLELDVFETEKKKMEMQKTPPVPNEELKEKLKIYNEIDKWLNCKEDAIQTKKIKEPEEK